VHSSGDTVACFVSERELIWFLMPCTLLVTQTVARLISDSELAWFFDVHSPGDTDCGLFRQ